MRYATSLVGLAIAVAACGGARPAATAASPTPAAPSATTASTPAGDLVPIELPSVGIRGLGPRDGREIVRHPEISSRTTTNTMFASPEAHAGPWAFGLGAHDLAMPAAKRPADERAWLAAIAKQYRKTTRVVPFEQGGLHGIEVAGVDDAGRAKTTRLLVAGSTLYFAEVDADGDAPPDGPTVRRFLDAFQVDLPWTLRAIERHGGAVFALPAAAIPVETADTSPTGTEIAAFYFGGAAEEEYMVTRTPLDAMPSGDAAESTLERATESAGGQPGWKVEKATALTFDGAAGREVVLRTANGRWARVRFLLAGGALFQIWFMANEGAHLESPRAERFLGSLQWRRAR